MDYATDNDANQDCSKSLQEFSSMDGWLTCIKWTLVVIIVLLYMHML